MSIVANDSLPDSWNILKIGEFAHTTSGGTPKRSFPEYYNGDIPWVKSGDLNDSTLFNVDEYISKLGLKKSSAKLFKPETVLIALYGATIGRLSILQVEAASNQAVCGISLPDEVSSKYLFYYLLSIREQLISKGKGGAQPNISQGVVKEIEVPIAPFRQQKHIVAKIEELYSHLDIGAAALNESKKLLRKYKQSILKAAVTGELTKRWRKENQDKLESTDDTLELILIERQTEYARKTALWEHTLAQWKANGEQGKRPSRPQKYKSFEGAFDDLEKLPFGWAWIKLGNLSVDISDGPFGSNLKSSDYVDEGIRVIRLENIGNLEFKNNKATYVTEEKYQLLKKHTVSAGDIIFSSFVIDGTRVVVLPENITQAINKADCFSLKAFGASIDASYLANFLATTSTYKRLENQVHGATRPRINTTQLKELEVPICSVEEQKEIVRLVNKKFESLERLSKEIDLQMIKAEKTKQSILASAFSGKLI